MLFRSSAENYGTPGVLSSYFMKNCHWENKNVPRYVTFINFKETLLFYGHFKDMLVTNYRAALGIWEIKFTVLECRRSLHCL